MQVGVVVNWTFVLSYFEKKKWTWWKTLKSVEVYGNCVFLLKIFWHEKRVFTGNVFYWLHTYKFNFKPVFFTVLFKTVFNHGVSLRRSSGIASSKGVDTWLILLLFSRGVECCDFLYISSSPEDDQLCCAGRDLDLTINVFKISLKKISSKTLLFPLRDRMIKIFRVVRTDRCRQWFRKSQNWIVLYDQFGHFCSKLAKMTVFVVEMIPKWKNNFHLTRNFH